MQRAFYLFVLLTFVAACNSNEGTINNKVATSAATQPISPERAHPDLKPVATYSEAITTETGRLNNWKFAVALYETHKTFTYRVEIQYKELNITDSLQLPDLGIAPKLVLQKGKEAHSCIVGFMDNKNVFKEYKLVSVTNGTVRIHTLKYYRVQRTTTVQ